MVALFFLPPAWFSLNFTFVLTLSFMILSKTLPTLLARVIPLSFEHFPFFHFPLYSLTIFPVCHCEGISFVFAMLLRTLWYFSMVSVLASMNISFGISSSPMASPLFSFLIASVISFVVTSCVGLFISVDSASFFYCLPDFLRPVCIFCSAFSGLVEVFKEFCYVFFGFLIVFNDVPVFCDCWVVTVIGFSFGFSFCFPQCF